MNSNRIDCRLIAGAALALGLLASQAASAAQSDVAAGNAAPIVVAQASAPVAGRVVVINPEASPVNLRGVRMAAAEGPDALRRYIWRTRMIYNYDYMDFAPKS